MAQIRIGVIGVAGRVGRMLVADIAATEGCALAGGIARPGSAALGQDLGELAGIPGSASPPPTTPKHCCAVLTSRSSSRPPPPPPGTPHSPRVSENLS